MKPRLRIIFVLMIILPLVLLIYLGIRYAVSERDILLANYRKVIEKELSTIDGLILSVCKRHQEKLMKVLPPGRIPKTDMLRLQNRNPLITQIFVLGPEGGLVYPDERGKISLREKKFLERSGTVIKNRNLFHHVNIRLRGEDLDQKLTVSIKERKAKQVKAPTVYDQSGWYAWYYGRDLMLYFWRQGKAGHIVCAEINLSWLLSEIIGELPETYRDSESLLDGRIVLMGLNEMIYQWGDYKGDHEGEPFLEIPVSYPLNIWKLKYYLSTGEERALQGRGGMYGMVLGILAAILTVLGFAWYFFREYTREMREAGQKVTFVNQVSHELKTPLTNIRMYAELLEENLDDECKKEKGFIGIIVSESRRLSRLIANILNFSRKSRGRLQLVLSDNDPDAVIKSVLESFSPVFDDSGIRVVLDLRTCRTVKLDRDILEQITGNLFSNVEKYAGRDSRVSVKSSFKGEVLTVSVEDDGPGIPESYREMIFLPFRRISNKLTDGVSGTGIGLSISRDLARLHGGDLVLKPSERGAHFCLTVKVGPAEE